MTGNQSNFHVAATELKSLGVLHFLKDFIVKLTGLTQQLKL